MTETFNCLIMGAAGRDFHNFQTFFRDRPQFRVCAFTAAQIPNIASRSFPAVLAGTNYDHDIPIHPESQIPQLIRDLNIDFVFLAYSDLSHEEVMHRASLVQACGASFALLGPRHTQLHSKKPVIAVTAVRTGAGKSPLSQWLARWLSARGLSVGILRHPMPYGDLRQQVVQRFADWQDLDRFECTLEEREEYEPYIEMGQAIYAGVDYDQILAAAETHSDIVLWDGGNNDFSFIQPDLNLVVVDALRPGHETSYYPGETNLRCADVVVLTKVREASPEVRQDVKERLADVNADAPIIEADLELIVDKPDVIRGRRVLIVEDGPTLTHGGMSHGAGTVAAGQNQPGEIVDPREFAVGSIAQAFKQYAHMGSVLPALGYSQEQQDELAETIRRCQPDVVIDASPCSLKRVLEFDMPVVRVDYQFRQVGGPSLETMLEKFLNSVAE